MKVPYLWLRQHADAWEIWTAHQQDEGRCAHVSEPEFGVGRQVVDGQDTLGQAGLLLHMEHRIRGSKEEEADP